MQESEINHALLFYKELCNLNSFNIYYESIVESLLEEFDYITEGNTEIFSDSTQEKFRDLKEKLMWYYSEFDYAKSPVFKFLDKEYISILRDYQKPLLESIEKDFSDTSIAFKKCLGEIVRPPDEEILKSITNLYKK